MAGGNTGDLNDSFDAGIETQATQYKADIRALAQKPEPEVRAKIEVEMKSVDAAITRRAEENPKSIPIQNSAARQALQSGDWTAALRRSEQAVQLARAGGNPRALENSMITRSMAHYAAKDFVGACSDAEGVLRGDPKNVTAFELQRFSCGRESGSILGNAEDKLKRFLAQQSPFVPHTPEGWAAMQERNPTADYQSIVLSMQARKRGDSAAALRFAEAAVAAMPSDPMAWTQRGLIRSDRNDLDSAVTDLSQAIALGMKWHVLYDVRAQALLKGGQFKAAMEDASLAILLSPRDATAYATRALAKAGLRMNGNDILADFKTAAELDPQRYGPLFEQAKGELAQRPLREETTPRVTQGTQSATSSAASTDENFQRQLLLAKIIWPSLGLAVIFLLFVLWKRRRSEGRLNNEIL